MTGALVALGVILALLVGKLYCEWRHYQRIVQDPLRIKDSER
jgi:hypothetical protein